MATKNKSKNTDQQPDVEHAAGLDPFNGEIYLFADETGFWIENWRTNHYSDYLTDADGELITDEAEAMKCFEAECTNTQFSQPLYW